MKGLGDQGGCSAVLINLEEERKKHMSEVIEDFQVGKECWRWTTNISRHVQRSSFAQ